MKIAVLIPCFNEEKTIAKVVTDWKSALPLADIIVCDNNSTDNSMELARKAGAIIMQERKQGKGHVMRRMFREVQADVYFMVDGDDTYPAQAAPEMLEKIKEGAHMVVADRMKTYMDENKRPLHNAGNTLVCLLLSRLFHQEIPDALSGLRAFRRSFVKTFPVFSDGFQIETEMCIHAASHRLDTCYVPVDYRDRKEGSQSKLKTIPDGIRVLLMTLRLLEQYRPLYFFGWIAAFLLLAAILLFIPVGLEYLQTGLVPRFPTLIVCGFLSMASLQSFFAGLVLNNIKKKEMRSFETEFIKISQYDNLSETSGRYDH